MNKNTVRYFRFVSNVNLNSAFFERDHVYPLPEVVVKQILPEAIVEVSQGEVEATQRSVADEQARLDELNRAGKRTTLHIEDGRMAEAALNPIVGRPVVRYPDAQKLDENTVSADDAGEVQVVEGTDTDAKKGTDFRKGINKK